MTQDTLKIRAKIFIDFMSRYEVIPTAYQMLDAPGMGLSCRVKPPMQQRLKFKFSVILTMHESCKYPYECFLNQRINKFFYFERGVPHFEGQ